ncbi:MAG TPA: hypothetical protein VGX23_32455 [Actinocrinis sp.]|nr:hypothetical protein [Actinocrinis sp.]
MPSLLEALEAREAEVRGRLEELTGLVAGAQAELDRLVITRETVCALLGPALRPARAGGDDRSAALFAPRRRALPPRPGARLPEASLAALKVIESSDVPLRARAVCTALGEADSGRVQAMRTRLARMADHGLIIAREPGLYEMAGPER